MPIIRITAAQIDKANRARKVALQKDPEYRRYEEHQQLLRQAAIQRKAQGEKATEARSAPRPSGSEVRPCDEHRRLEREGIPGDVERES